MATTNIDAPVEDTAGISRRKVMKVGAAAAWAAPVITMATAAPALAVSGEGELRIVGYANNRRRRNPKRMDVAVRKVRNVGSGRAGQVTLVVTVPERRKGALSEPPILVNGPSKGWDYVGRDGSKRDFTFVSNRRVPAGGETPELRFTLKLASAKRYNRPFQTTATALADNASPSSASASER